MANDLLQLLLMRYRDLLERRIVPNRTTLVRWMNLSDDPFPAAVKLGENSIAWRAAEVEAWLERRARVIPVDPKKPRPGPTQRKAEKAS